MSAVWSVPALWPGETVAVLAAGPSLTREQCESLHGKLRVIAVNNVGIPTPIDGVEQPAFAPWADLLYAADAKWWHAYQVKALAFAGLKVTLKPNPFEGVYQLAQSQERIFDPRPAYVCSGGNSGYQAVQVAVHAGAKRIVLLGFDMRDGLGKRRHYFGNHPPRLNSQQAYHAWRAAFDRLAPVLAARGVEVVNATPKSALTAFRRVDLHTVLGG